MIMDFLGSIVHFAMNMVRFALDLALGAIDFVVGLLGGLLSLAFSLMWLGVIVGVIVFFVRRRRGARKQHATGNPNGHIYDLGDEEFTSFYDQKEAAPFTRNE